MSMMIRLALFDFDNTIAKGDSIVSFLLYAVRTGNASVFRLLSGVGGYLRARIRRSSSSKYKESALSFMKRFSEEERKQFCREYIQARVLPSIYPEALREMAQCRAEGFTVVIVSASVSLYMMELLSFLPADAMICTDAYLSLDGRYSGKLGPNCKGKEKVVRIQRWLEQRRLEADWKHSRSYGDSWSDRFMLDLTGTQTLINPCPDLRERYPDARVCAWNIQEENP